MFNAKQSKKNDVNNMILFFTPTSKITPAGIEIIERCLKESSFDYIKTNNNSNVDYNIYAFLIEAGELETKESKIFNKEVKMVNLKLIDKYYDTIRCTLWGELAVAFDPSSVKKVMILKTVQSRSFQEEVYITSVRNTHIFYDIKSARAESLIERINVHFYGVD